MRKSHKAGCKCRRCATEGYRLKRKGDFWVRLLEPDKWLWLRDRRLATVRVEGR